MDDEDAEGDEEPLPIPKAAGKKGAASDAKTKEKLFKVIPSMLKLSACLLQTWSAFDIA